MDSQRLKLRKYVKFSHITIIICIKGNIILPLLIVNIALNSCALKIENILVPLGPNMLVVLSFTYRICNYDCNISKTSNNWYLYLVLYSKDIGKDNYNENQTSFIISR